MHFRGDAKVPEGPVATAVELGVESAQTSSGGEEPDYQEVELGLLKPERRYEATICPVAEGTQLANVKESTGLNVTISRTESGDGQESGPAVACQLSTPKEGEIIHFFSADFVDESGAVKHRAFSIAGKVMSSDKGMPHHTCQAQRVRACLPCNTSALPKLLVQHYVSCSTTFLCASSGVRTVVLDPCHSLCVSPAVEVLNHSPSNTRLVSVRTWQVCSWHFSLATHTSNHDSTLFPALQTLGGHVQAHPRRRRL